MNLPKLPSSEKKIDKITIIWLLVSHKVIEFIFLPKNLLKLLIIVCNKFDIIYVVQNMYEFHSIEDYKKNGIKNGNEKNKKKT